MSALVGTPQVSLLPHLEEQPLTPICGLQQMEELSQQTCKLQPT